MNSETWKKVKSVFNEASELPEGERSSFLAQFEDEIRLEVEKMLGAVKEESFLLNEPIVDLKEFVETPMPKQIGNYKIIRQIGRGGMGTVYEAFRETETFKQHVALKVIRHGIDNEIILKRFRAEQQILASLEHPNIGRFLDGGKTIEGLPFYAMEFIEGLPIDEFCQQKRLTNEEKIKLFREVCAAVSYAHTNLIVHRDLKPSNIIVTANGTPKLLDFGIAKVLDVNSTEAGTATQLGMMTPQYASPEQIRGEKVNTLSDVYSLGIIFYEILTGIKPYEIEGKNYAEILEIITQTRPAKPSENQRSKIKDQRSNPDLDNIVLKSLQKLPERRYQSVEQFSEDLRRHLVGLPITARPDTFGYRFSKFVERNKIGVAAGVLVFLSLLTGIGLASWQAYRAEKQRLLAEKRFAEVRTIANNVVFKYHDEIAKLNGSTAVREMLVKDATTYLDNLAADSANDADLEQELGLAYLKLADVQGKIYAANVGNTDGALESYDKSINLLEKAVEAKPNEKSPKEDLIKAIDAKVSLMARSDFKSADKFVLLDKSSKILEDLIKNEPENPKLMAQLATLYIRYGDSVGSLNDKGSLLKKLEYHQKAIPVAEKLLQISPNDPGNLKILAQTNQRIGTDYFWLGQNAELNKLFEEAKPFFQQALPYHQKMLELIDQAILIKPNDPSLKRNRIAVISSYAETISRNGNEKEALELVNKALSLAKEIQENDPSNQEAKFEVATIYELRAKIYSIFNEDEKAIENYQKAAEITEAVYKADNGNLESLTAFKASLENLRKINEKLGRKTESELYERKSKELSDLLKNKRP
ncbi:MAG: protein kinase [Pyrinomonadaceae bacterium]|nr:protein kinase [Pyrinomonadaceae bacterium]